MNEMFTVLLLVYQRKAKREILNQLHWMIATSARSAAVLRCFAWTAVQKWVKMDLMKTSNIKHRFSRVQSGSFSLK